MKRLIVLLSVVVLAAAAPARGWCEASCLVPAEASATPHCPAHGPSTEHTQIAGSAIDDCPVLESARPTTARLDAQLTVAGAAPFQHQSRSHVVASSIPHGSATTVFERCTPLRI